MLYSSMVLLTPAAGKDFKFQVRATTDQRTVELRNVVGMLPGQTHKRPAKTWCSRAITTTWAS